MSRFTLNYPICFAAAGPRSVASLTPLDSESQKQGEEGLRFKPSSAAVSAAFLLSMRASRYS